MAPEGIEDVRGLQTGVAEERSEPAWYRKVGTPVENAGKLWRLSRRRSWVRAPSLPPNVNEINVLCSLWRPRRNPGDKRPKGERGSGSVAFKLTGAARHRVDKQ